MDFNLPPIKSIPEMTFESLSKELRSFQAGLADSLEIGLRVGGGDLTMYPHGLRLVGQMIVFDGTDAEGNQASLVQHYSMVTMLLVAAPKLGPNARRIGF